MTDTEKKIEECKRKIDELKKRICYCQNRICKTQTEIMDLKGRHEFLDFLDKNKKTQKNIEELNKELEETKKQIPDFNEETYLQYKKYFELENELNIESKFRDEKNEMKVLIEKEKKLKQELEQELCYLHKEQATLEDELKKELAKENI